MEKKLLSFYSALKESFTFILEGAAELKKKYVETEKISQEDFDFLMDNDPSNTKKYLKWMIKMFLQDPGRKRHIVDAITLFSQNVEKKAIVGPDSNIQKYKFLDDVDSVNSQASKKVSKSSVKKEIKAEGADKVFEDADILIVSPSTHEASKQYGKGTKWCTTSDSSQHWDTYFQKGVKLYYIIKKSDNSKYAVAVYPDGKTKECFDAKDNSISLNKVVKSLGLK